MSFCKLDKGDCSKIRRLRFVLMNIVLLSLLCVCWLIHYGYYMVCHKTYYIIRHCTNTDTYYIIRHCTNTDTFSLFQITIYLHKTFPPIHSKHSSILSQPRRPASSSLAVACCICLPACWLCPNGRWNGRLYVSRCLMRGTLNLALLFVSVVKFRSEWVRLVSRNCP